MQSLHDRSETQYIAVKPQLRKYHSATSKKITTRKRTTTSETEERINCFFFLNEKPGPHSSPAYIFLSGLFSLSLAHLDESLGAGGVFFLALALALNISGRKRKGSWHYAHSPTGFLLLFRWHVPFLEY